MRFVLQFLFLIYPRNGLDVFNLMTLIAGKLMNSISRWDIKSVNEKKKYTVCIAWLLEFIVWSANLT